MKTESLSRTLLGLIFCLSFLSGVYKAYSDELEIVDIRRNITLANDEAPYKDYYIQLGGQSLKLNQIVKATRKIQVKSGGQKIVGEFNTPVAKLKIIHIEKNVAIAREIELLSRQDYPMLEQVGVMVGDKIDPKE